MLFKCCVNEVYKYWVNQGFKNFVAKILRKSREFVCSSDLFIASRTPMTRPQGLAAALLASSEPPGTRPRSLAAEVLLATEVTGPSSTCSHRTFWQLRVGFVLLMQRWTMQPLAFISIWASTDPVRIMVKPGKVPPYGDKFFEFMWLLAPCLPILGPKILAAIETKSINTLLDEQITVWVKYVNIVRIADSDLIVFSL